MEPSYRISEESQIVVTKTVGLSGTIKLYDIFKEDLDKKYNERFTEPVRSYTDRLLYNKEYEVLRDYKWELIVEAGYGGIFNALFNLGYQTGLGMIVDIMSLPITQQTVEFADHAGVNAYQLHSAGSMVIACTNGIKLADKLKESGVEAAVVGYMTKDKARIVRVCSEDRFLVPVTKDELFKVGDRTNFRKEYPKDLIIRAFDEF